MRARISRLVFSSLFESVSGSSEPKLPYNGILYSSSTHFSTIPNRPMRGERRENRREDHFGEDDDEKWTRKTPQNHSPQSLNRPMRGERRGHQSDSLFGNLERDISIHDDGKMTKSHQDFPNQMAGRPMRGERRKDQPDASFLREFKLSDDGPIVGGKREEQSESLFLRNPDAGGDFNEGGRRKGSPQRSSVQSPETEDTVQDADEIFKKMKETGLIPNAVAMLDGLCKDGLIQEAMKLFGLMREKGTIPEVVIYTAVVEGFCKAMKFDDAKRIFRKMQNNGISPNAFSYKVLIHGLCKGKKLEDAVEFCVEMLEAGHSPAVPTFVSLVDGLCREKGVEEAESVVRRLREKGYGIDEKAVREHLDKKGPFQSSVSHIVFEKKSSQRPF